MILRGREKSSNSKRTVLEQACRLGWADDFTRMTQATKLLLFGPFRKPASDIREVESWHACIENVMLHALFTQRGGYFKYWWRAAFI